MFAGTGTLDGCGEEFCRGSKGICRKCTLFRRSVVVQDATLDVRVCICVWGWPQPKTTIATIARNRITTDFIDVSPDYCLDCRLAPYGRHPIRHTDCKP